MADVLEGAVTPIFEEEHGLAIFGADIRGVHLRIDVAIDHEKIRPAVVLPVDEAIAPADVRAGARRDSRWVRVVAEVHVAIVAIEDGVLVAEMGDSDAEAAGVKVVAQSDAHVGLFRAILADGYAGGVGDVFKMAVAFVSIEIVGLAVVGDKKIEAPVAVEIHPNGGETEAILGIGDSGGFGNICKSAITVVVVQVVGRTFQATRAALHVDALVLASFAGAEDGKVVEAERNVMRYEKIGPAIAVVVAKCGARCPAGVAGQACFLGDVGERAIAVVAVEDYATEAGYEQIGPAVIVVVGYSRAHCPARETDACVVGDICKCAVVIVAV